MVDTLDVFVAEQHVGILERFEDERQRFSFIDEYCVRQRAKRRVLGQIFEDRYPKAIDVGGPIGWFTHLLPQGAMRRWQSGLVGVDEDDSFGLLVELGHDLPGAVRLSPSSSEVGQSKTAAGGPSNPQFPELKSLFKFSLAGAQWKLSANATDKGLTMSVVRDARPCIAKFHATEFPGLPRAEFATMQWAKAAGLETPPCQLNQTSDFDQLPDAIPTGDGAVFVIERFDRSAGSVKRIHMEDFAQILDRPPGTQQYASCYEEVASVIRWITPTCRSKYLDQLVFSVLCGNGDAHLKNFSLLYRQPRTAVLSPCYDLVPTIAYGDKDLALELGGTKSWNDLGLDRFQSLLVNLGWNPDQGRIHIVEFARSAMECWEREEVQGLFNDRIRESLLSHHGQLKLISEI